MSDTSVHQVVARELWRRLDGYHSVVYWDPEPAEEYRTLGLRGWSRYFASRSAALGSVTAEVVASTFYTFDPSLVRHGLGGVWESMSPPAVSAARLRGADRCLRRRLGEAMRIDELTSAAQLTRAAVEGLPPNGRTLFAAHQTLAWPDDPHLALWHAATLYREYRGDGHVAVLLSADVGPREALVLDAAWGGLPADFLRANRGWSEADWSSAVDEARRRGWVDAEGIATNEGSRFRESLEDVTDRASMAPWSKLGERRTNELLSALDAVQSAIRR